MPPKKKKPGDDDKKKAPMDPIGAQTQSAPTDLQEVLRLMLGSMEKGFIASAQNLPKTGSFTQTGSSTQPSIENKPTSSSVQTPDKKTVASYAKKLPTKTWSQTLASEDEKTRALQVLSKQEYDLINLRSGQLLAKQQPKVAQSQKQMVIAPSQTIATLPQITPQTSANLNTPFIKKPGMVQNIVQIEPEFFLETPNLTALNIFPSGFYYKPTTFKKTREYYELILVHSESAEITRYRDQQDDTNFTHYTLKILQVLTPSQWGPNLNKPRLWEIDFEPNGYTYWDYHDAWYNVFWDQNKSFKHTWFIFWKMRTKYTFPHWFMNRWWDFFGPVPEIFPPIVQRAFELFKTKFNTSVEPAIPVDLHYFSKMAVSWIFSWHFWFSHNNRSDTKMPWLQRIPTVKWWGKFNVKRIDSDAVVQWFRDNPEYLCVSEQSIFLNQRARIQSKLATVSNKQEFIQELSSMIRMLNEAEGSSQNQSQTHTQASSSSSLPEPNQEDDDYAVDLSED